MGSVIRLVKVSPCPPIEDCEPFMVQASLIRAVEIPDTDPPGPDGVVLVELSDRPGHFWTWGLTPADLPEGTPIAYEREPR